MKRFLAFALLAAVACRRPEYHEPDPYDVDVSPPAPERVLREPVNHRFKDTKSDKEFLLRMYRDHLDETFTDDIVTVIEPGRLTERFPTAEEFDYAMNVFIASWITAGQTEQLEHSRRLYDEELRRTKEQVDEQIYAKERAVARLAELRLDAASELEAIRGTAGYPAKPGQVDFLQSEIRRLDGTIEAERAMIAMLRHKRYLKDQGAEIAKLRELLGDK